MSTSKPSDAQKHERRVVRVEQHFPVIDNATMDALCGRETKKTESKQPSRCTHANLKWIGKGVDGYSCECVYCAKPFLLTELDGPQKPEEDAKTDEACRHLRTHINPEDRVGTCTCEQCGKPLQLSDAVNILLDAMREAIKDPKPIETKQPGDTVRFGERDQFCVGDIVTVKGKRRVVLKDCQAIMSIWGSYPNGKLHYIESCDPDDPQSIADWKYTGESMQMYSSLDI